MPMEDRITEGDVYEYMLGRIRERGVRTGSSGRHGTSSGYGRADGAAAGRRDLRSGLRHSRLSGRSR